MKILIISPTQIGIGGIAQHVINLSKFLILHKHTVKIISTQNTLYIPISGLKNISFTIFSFFKIIQMNNFNIFHAQNPISAIAFKILNGKKILSLQGMYSENISMLHGNILGKLSKYLEKNVLQWTDAVIVSSQDMYEIYKKYHTRVFFIPNAIDIDALPLESEKLFDNQIIYAGRLSKEKGFLDILEIIDHLPKNFHMIIIGNGPEVSKIKNMEKKHANIHYFGLKDKQNTIKLIRGSKILIQPSLLEAGTSTSILEAMACKTCVITTPVGGNKESIRHLDTGYVVNFNSPDEILDGINFLLTNYEKRNEIIENAFNEVKKNDWKNVIHMYLKIYEDLTKIK